MSNHFHFESGQSCNGQAARRMAVERARGVLGKGKPGRPARGTRGGPGGKIWACLSIDLFFDGIFKRALGKFSNFICVDIALRQF